jgi:hypothetical protein
MLNGLVIMLTMAAFEGMMCMLSVGSAVRVQPQHIKSSVPQQRNNGVNTQKYH